MIAHRQTKVGRTEMDIHFLDDGREQDYERFLQRFEFSSFFTSNGYRKLLQALLGDEDRYLLAYQGGELVGALPAFIKTSPSGGSVLNSLPYYGSNGGAIAVGGDARTKAALLRAFNQLADDRGCIASTVINSPFDDDHAFYDEHANADYVDERIGQWTVLPRAGDTVEDELMASYHSKTRNMVRKAAKNGVEVEVDGSAEAFSFLQETHTHNMAAVGGLPKSEKFFELVPRHFEADADYTVHVAMHGGQPVAALLLFYHHHTVEYFTPAIVEEFRSLQPLSLLVYRAMLDAVRRGFRYWNWGGTGINQTSLHTFKKRWGTTDRNYFYFSRLLDKSVLARTPEQLLQQFPNYYVVPFSALG